MKNHRTLSALAVTAFFFFCVNTLSAQTAAKAIYVVNSPSTEMSFDAQVLQDGQAGKFILAVENPELLKEVQALPINPSETVYHSEKDLI